MRMAIFGMPGHLEVLIGAGHVVYLEQVGAGERDSGSAVTPAGHGRMVC